MSTDFTELPKAHGIAISMGGEGYWRDNVFVMRSWRSNEYEAVHLHARDKVQEASGGIGSDIAFSRNAGHIARLTAPPLASACLTSLTLPLGA